VEFSPQRKKTKGHRITPTLLTAPSEGDSSHVGAVNPVKNLLSSFTRIAEGKEDVDSATIATTTIATTTATAVRSDRGCDSEELERASPAMLTDQGIANGHQINDEVTASQVDHTSNKGASNGNNAFSTMKMKSSAISSSVLKPKAKVTSTKTAASKSHLKISKPVGSMHHHHHSSASTSSIPATVLLSDGIEDRVSTSIQGSVSTARSSSTTAAAAAARSTPNAKMITSFLIAAGGAIEGTVMAPSILVERDVVVIDD
jgi:hypothetical protein